MLIDFFLTRQRRILHLLRRSHSELLFVYFLALAAFINFCVPHVPFNTISDRNTGHTLLRSYSINCSLRIRAYARLPAYARL